MAEGKKKKKKEETEEEEDNHGGDRTLSIRYYDNQDLHNELVSHSNIHKLFTINFSDSKH